MTPEHLVDEKAKKCSKNEGEHTGKTEHPEGALTVGLPYSSHKHRECPGQFEF